jgi:hypothetical protein
MKGAAMDNGVMANGDLVTDEGFASFKGAVDHCPVLDIYLVTDPDAVHVPPNYGIKPDAAIHAHHHIPYNGGVGRYETVFTPFWEMILYR